MKPSLTSARALPILLAALPVLGAAGCPLLGPSALPTNEVQIETVVPGAAFPVDLAFAPDGRTFYTEKATGNIRVIKDGALLPTPFANLPANSFNERGLLGIALHPDFAANGLVYAFYVHSSTGAASTGRNEAVDSRVVRIRSAGDVADGSAEVLVNLPITDATNHNGGIIRFGPDGLLYVTHGDLGFLYHDSQDPSLLPGKLLRYHDDGTIPSDNPFGPANPVFAIGLRNPFGMDFDASGRLYANENGPNNHDELNLIVAGGNYGWPLVHGFADDAIGDPTGEVAFAAAHPEYRDPLVDKSDGSVGAAGAAVNRGSLFGSALRGQVFFGEYATGRIHRARLSDDGASLMEQALLITIPTPVNGMAAAPDGSLWVTTPTSILRLAP